MMTRAEHLQWCKDRALEELEFSGPTNAIASMASDLNKHPETEGHPGIMLGMMLMMGGRMATADEVRRHIEGFN